jgi:serine/threonine protein kinase
LLEAMGICASFLAPTLERLYEVDERQVLGEGTYSVVFRGRTRATGVPVAVKRIDKRQHALGRPQLWQDEVALLRQCGEHPHVIALRDVFETPTHVFIIMELAEGGELFQTLITVRRTNSVSCG